jgi:GH43 family beta-xylosidase
MEDEKESVYGPGHAAFTTSPDGTETWMSYHAQNTSEPNNPQRIAYLDKIEWDLIGYPIFPKPHGQDSPQAVPSGQM